MLRTKEPLEPLLQVCERVGSFYVADVWRSRRWQSSSPKEMESGGITKVPPHLVYQLAVVQKNSKKSLNGEYCIIESGWEGAFRVPPEMVHIQK